ncbi:putative secreted protein with PEP-CTERM sorting signal/MYXO-CTERM domain-containing protein [Marinobacter pelagius]|uniref:Putative secreted protein with PEP-CTERM sorting signal/MYXO-CTERM domain-containing protein n=1 Tax=Marinobacter pelagius TaxID=379482 RepID=A0A366GHW0_9GAMM|nr:PEP-CTERM sorting domain-containing protein [Marinobacter pelagius]RBP26460.1 putative secreted protein with PEP-CTERM sorting signal/MYXO-CTERM domain-containing protein [Marinobacter pelagius]
MKFKGRFLPSLLAAGCLAGAGAAQAGMITYDTWLPDDGAVGNYIFTVEHDEVGGRFNYNLTVDPWNADPLGLFIDLGDNTVGDVDLIQDSGGVELYATNTSDDSCDTGCNLNGGPGGSLIVPDEPNGLWELVFRLGETGGADLQQTFSWSTADFELGLSDFGLVAIRSQVLCTGDDLLPGDADDCEGSDKSYSGTTTVSVPEPGTLGLLGLGLLALAIRRVKAS